MRETNIWRKRRRIFRKRKIEHEDEKKMSWKPERSLPIPINVYTFARWISFHRFESMSYQRFVFWMSVRWNVITMMSDLHCMFSVNVTMYALAFEGALLVTSRLSSSYDISYVVLFTIILIINVKIFFVISAIHPSRNIKSSYIQWIQNKNIKCKKMKELKKNSYAFLCFF